MFPLRKILFPVDFSERCLQTVPYVAAITRKFEAELIILHAFSIFHDFAYGAESSKAVYSPYEDLMRRRHLAELESFACKEFKDLRVSRIFQVSDATDAIIQCVHENEIDVIIMPTHGHGRFRQSLVGSVTSKVLHDTTCPVWTSSHSDSLVTSAPYEARSIVCAVDLDFEAAHVVRAASDIAARYRAVVRLVHAIISPNRVPGAAEEAPFLRFLLKRATSQLTTLQRELQTDFGVCIQHGKVANVICKVAADCNAQLVVIGRGQMQESLGRLQTNVTAIIREAPCPVLSV